MLSPAEEVHDRLIDYFDALYHGDVPLFTKLFHPKACLFSPTGGELLVLDVPSYLDIVAGRQAPAARGDRRDDRILSIDIPTSTTAHARVQELFLPKRFTDELTFIRVQDEWKIISKVWHFEIEPVD